MINALHLLWIVPLVSALAFMLAAVLKVSGKNDDKKHATWEQSKDYNGFCVCSQCRDCYIEPGWLKMKKWRYYPNRGAKMDGGVNDA